MRRRRCFILIWDLGSAKGRTSFGIWDLRITVRSERNEVFCFCFFDIVDTGGPAGEAADVAVVDIAVGVHFTGVGAVLFGVFGQVVVYAVEHNIVVQEEIDCIEKLLPLSAGVDDYFVSALVEVVNAFFCIGDKFADIGEFVLDDGAVEVD